MSNPTNNWEERFYELLEGVNMHHSAVSCFRDAIRVHNLKSFIKEVEQKAREEEVSKLKPLMVLDVFEYKDRSYIAVEAPKELGEKNLEFSYKIKE